MAEWKYTNSLYSKTVQGLIQNIISEKKKLDRAHRILEINQLQTCFVRWSQITSDLKILRNRKQSAYGYYASVLKKEFLKMARQQVQITNRKLSKFMAKRRFQDKAYYFHMMKENLKNQKQLTRK